MSAKKQKLYHNEQGAAIVPTYSSNEAMQVSGLTVAGPTSSPTSSSKLSSKMQGLYDDFGGFDYLSETTCWLDAEVGRKRNFRDPRNRLLGQLVWIYGDSEHRIEQIRLLFHGASVRDKEIVLNCRRRLASVSRTVEYELGEWIIVELDQFIPANPSANLNNPLFIYSKLYSASEKLNPKDSYLEAAKVNASSSMASSVKGSISICDFLQSLPQTENLEQLLLNAAPIPKLILYISPIQPPAMEGASGILTRRIVYLFDGERSFPIPLHLWDQMSLLKWPENVKAYSIHNCNVRTFRDYQIYLTMKVSGGYIRPLTGIPIPKRIEKFYSLFQDDAFLSKNIPNAIVRRQVEERKHLEWKNNARCFLSSVTRCKSTFVVHWNATELLQHLQKSTNYGNEDDEEDDEEMFLNVMVDECYLRNGRFVLKSLLKVDLYCEGGENPIVKDLMLDLKGSNASEEKDPTLYTIANPLMLYRISHCSDDLMGVTLYLQIPKKYDGTSSQIVVSRLDLLI